MKRVIIYSLIIVSAMILWGCPNADDKIRQRIETFCQKSDFGVYDGDSKLFEFNSTNCQIVFSADDGICRLQKDDQSAYMNYKITGDVVLNGKVTVTVTSKGSKVTGIRNTPMTVQKIEDNKVWLWQPDKEYGHILYWEE